MQTENRVKRLDIPYHVILDILLPSNTRTTISECDLPKDARIIHAEADLQRRRFTFYICSKEFEALEPGQEVNPIYPLFTVEQNRPSVPLTPNTFDKVIIDEEIKEQPDGKEDAKMRQDL